MSRPKCFIQWALRIRERESEFENSKIAQVLYDRMGSQQSQGKIREVSFLYQHALAIRKRAFDPIIP